MPVAPSLRDHHPDHQLPLFAGGRASRRHADPPQRAACGQADRLPARMPRPGRSSCARPPTGVIARPPSPASSPTRALVHGCAWKDLAVLCRYRAQQTPVAAALDAAGVPRSPLPGARLFTLATGAPAARLPRLDRGSVRSRPGRRRASGPQARPAGCRAAGRGRAACTLAEGRARQRPAGPGRSPARPSRRDRRARPRVAAGSLAAPVEEGGPTVVLEAARLLSLDHGSLQSYLTAWDAWAAREEADGDAEPAAPSAGDHDGVVITTIHAAKGREYRSVVIADYAVDLSALSPGELEEERRVLYVALTRAAENVLLTCDTRKRPPHQFVRELADPPSRELASRLRRELAHLGAGQAPVTQDSNDPAGRSPGRAAAAARPGAHRPAGRIPVVPARLASAPSRRRRGLRERAELKGPRPAASAEAVRTRDPGPRATGSRDPRDAAASAASRDPRSPLSIGAAERDNVSSGNPHHTGDQDVRRTRRRRPASACRRPAP